MASVPNMRLTPAPRTPGAPAGPEGEGGDLFAKLLPPTPDSEPAADGLIPAALLGEDGEPVVDVRPSQNAGDDEDEDGSALIAQFTPPPPELLQRIGVQAPEAPPKDKTAITATAQPVAEPIDPTILPTAVETPTAAVAVSQAPAATVAAPKIMPGQNTKAPPHPVPGHSAAKPAALAPAQPTPTVEGLVPAAAGQPDAEPPIKAKSGVERPMKAAVTAALESGKAVRPELRPQPIAPPAAEAKPASAPTPASSTKQPSESIQVANTPPTPSVTPAAISPLMAMMSTAAEPATPAADPAAKIADTPRPAELMIEHELDLANESEWLDRLARDIARTGDGDAPMRFRLHPQTLGHLRVELAQGDNGTAIRLTADTESARAILAEAQPRLVAEARAHGVRIAETHVDLNPSGGGNAWGDPRRQEDARQTAPFIRTTRGRDDDPNNAGEPPRGRTDRYA